VVFTLWGPFIFNAMSKDPAILFYTSDFLSGTAFFTDEQRGQYIKLLCEQHQNGHIPEEHMINICKSYDSPVLKKFVKDTQGSFFNERMEKEILKRQTYSESRRNNRIGKPKDDFAPTYDNTHVETYDKDMSLHMENGNDNSNSSLGSIEEYWEKWKNYKKAEFGFEFKGPDSESTSKTELLNLCENSIEEAIDIIDYSIAQGYKGFVKRKDKKNGKPGKQTGATVSGIANAVAKTFASDFRVSDEKH
jgi:uncharacterized protein YdaU (DUF1376 family)